MSQSVARSFKSKSTPVGRQEANDSHVGKYKVMNFRGNKKKSSEHSNAKKRIHSTDMGQTGQPNQVLGYHREEYQKPWNQTNNLENVS